jgi:HEAT repeat protein
MPVTMQQVLAEIDKDEPNYARAAKLGPDAVPHLRQIAEADDPLRASKAAYLASLIPGQGSVDLLTAAAAHHAPEVRVAVAHALRNTKEAPPAVLETLLEDSDPGVRKVTLGTVGHLNVPALRAKVAAIAKDDDEEFLRDAAGTTMKAMTG